MLEKLKRLVITSVSIVFLGANVATASYINSIKQTHSSTLPFNTQNLPNGATFFCGLSDDDVPTTLAMGADGNVYPIIRWISTFESREGRTPEERCNTVSNNFQRYYSSGTLHYLRGGRSPEGLSTICVAAEQGGACIGTLFTLAPDTNANQTVRNLWELSEGTRGPLYQTGNLYYLNINTLVPLEQQ